MRLCGARLGQLISILAAEGLGPGLGQDLSFSEQGTIARRAAAQLVARTRTGTPMNPYRRLG